MNLPPMNLPAVALCIVAVGFAFRFDYITPAGPAHIVVRVNRWTGASDVFIPSRWEAVPGSEVSVDQVFLLALSAGAILIGAGAGAWLAATARRIWLNMPEGTLAPRDPVSPKPAPDVTENKFGQSVFHMPPPKP